MGRSRWAAAVLVIVIAVSGCELGRGSEQLGQRRASSGVSECKADATPETEHRRQANVMEGRAPTRMVVDASDDRGPISDLVYGVNHRYPFEGFGSWDPSERHPVPLFVDRYRHSGFTAIRFPGGRTANNYHWERAIGPLEKREKHADAAFGRIPAYAEPMTNEFGPDEFGRLLEVTGSEGTIVLNFPTGDADEAADWVEYMNTPVGQNPRGGVAWARVRARNGSRDPYGVKYWEVGNELAGALTFWIGEASEFQRAEKYAFGGRSKIEQEPVIKNLDYSDSASVSKGTPSQSFSVQFPPVGQGSETVFVDGEAWSRVDSLGSSGEEKVYEISYRTGKIRFGDGTHGQIPPKGAKITVSYTSGPHDGFVDFYREIKEVDPTAQVGASFNSPGFLEHMGSEHPYDFLVGHSYSFFRDDPANIRELHDLMMTLPDDQASKVVDSKDAIARFAGDRADDIEMIISEWAMSTGSNLGIGRMDYVPNSYPMSLDGGLYVALMLARWIELGIPLAQKHVVVDVNPNDLPSGYEKEQSPYQSLVGWSPCFVASAGALVFRMFSRMMGDTQIADQIVGNQTKKIFNGKTVGLLDAIASRDGRSVYLMVINKSLSRDVPAEVVLESFEPEGPATMWTLNGPSHLSYNTAEDPNGVSITSATEDGLGTRFGYEFPAHSVTAIKLTGRSDP